MNCVHERIEDSLSRLQEAHWYIHQIERYYHDPEPFRYSTNSFLRALKEIPQVLKMEMQNVKGFKTWYKAQDESLKADPLIRLLSSKRDFVVHRGELDLQSSGSIGVSKWGKFKLGLSWPVHPSESSEDAYYAFVDAIKKNPIVLEVFAPQEDQLPCVEREWRLPDLPDRDVYEIVIAGWRTTAEVISNTIVWLGGEPLDVSIGCAHNLEEVRLKLFSREEFLKRVAS